MEDEQLCCWANTKAHSPPSPSPTTSTSVDDCSKTPAEWTAGAAAEVDSKGDAEQNEGDPPSGPEKRRRRSCDVEDEIACDGGWRGRDDEPVEPRDGRDAFARGDDDEVGGGGDGVRRRPIRRLPRRY